MNIQTVLCPVDFSTCSFSVTRQAAELAGKLGARVVLLHVSELPPGLSADTHLAGGTPAERLGADARARLASFEEAIRALGVAAETRVALGPIAPTVLSMADQLPADLIVMGTHGRTGLARLVLGSVAEAVVHGSNVPVMLVRRHPRPECGRESCAWCAEGGRSAAERQIDAESTG